VAKYHDVWVLTRPDESKASIDAELLNNPIPNLHFVYFTTPYLGWLWKLGQSGPMQIHYYLWQIQAYFVGRRLNREVKFDIIHHVTFVRYSTPSFLSFLSVPFVWGPIGGGESAPTPFWKEFSFRSKVYETLRVAWRWLGEIDPFTKATARRCALACSTTEDTSKRLKELGAPNVKIFPESGIASQELEQLAKCPLPTGQPVRFVSIARLLHWKGFYLSVKAFAKANLPDAEYWLIGDGPEMENLVNLASDLGVTDQIKFFGLLPREKVLEKLGQCSVLVHPSLHDSGGWVCLEAMAAGRPVICLDLGGPAQQVTSETGIKVPAYSPNSAVEGLSNAMTQLALDEQLRIRMGRAGHKRVQENYSWEARGKQLSEIYASVLMLL
jgi:glycosyltransferase involved in cell wall biosynthesis